MDRVFIYSLYVEFTLQSCCVLNTIARRSTCTGGCYPLWKLPIGSGRMLWRNMSGFHCSSFFWKEKVLVVLNYEIDIPCGFQWFAGARR